MINNTAVSPLTARSITPFAEIVHQPAIFCLLLGLKSGDIVSIIFGMCRMWEIVLTFFLIGKLAYKINCRKSYRRQGIYFVSFCPLHFRNRA